MLQGALDKAAACDQTCASSCCLVRSAGITSAAGRTFLEEGLEFAWQRGFGGSEFKVAPSSWVCPLFDLTEALEGTFKNS